MKTITVEEATRNFSGVLEIVEQMGEEVLIMRNNQIVARIVPEPGIQTAIEIFQDVAGVLNRDTADSLSTGVAAFREDFSHTRER